eukprot:c27671_g3_i1 orf=86-3106(+)
MMDDFERAIIFSFDQSGGVDAQLRAQAMAYCQQAKLSPSILQACIEKFRTSQFAEVQFWCLQTLEELIRHRYTVFNLQERLFLQTSLIAAICNYGLDGELSQSGNSTTTTLSKPVFVRNKLAQVVVVLIYVDYPSGWPSVFLDLLGSLSKGPPVVDMCFRILNTLDEEVISLDYPRKSDELAVATRIKDAMRQQCVTQIVEACYNLIVSYRGTRPELAAAVLESLQRFVSWIDIGLVANDSFIPLLLEFLGSPGEPIELRKASADCLLSMVSKRMDASSKLSLLQRLQIGQVCSCIVEEQNSEFTLKLTFLLTGVATEILDSSKNFTSIETSDQTLAAIDLAAEMLDAILPSIFYLMQHGDEESSSTTFQFFSGYVSGMKTMGTLNEKQASHLKQILQVIQTRIRYDAGDRDSLDQPDDVGKEEEDRMAEYRRDLFSLIRNIHRIAPDVTRGTAKDNLAITLTKQDASFEDVEACIMLLYILGEGVGEEALKPGSGPIEEMVGMLLSSQVPCHSHRLVALLYLETVTRYVRFVQHHAEYIPLVLTVFLDKRGIHHPNPIVRARASYLFMRFVKVLRVQLLPFLENILQNLQDILANFAITKTSLKKAQLMGSDSLEDASHIFEAVGLLIGMEELPVEKQTKFLSALLIPICSQVDSLLASVPVQGDPIIPAGTVSALQQSISAINSLSKGFGEHLATDSRPSIGIMFGQAMDVLLRVLLSFPKNKVLRSKVISFLHRMVEMLGSAVFPFLPTAIEQLLVESEPKEMVEFLLLINQLLNKFKSGMRDILQQLFPFVVSRIFVMLPKDTIPDGPGSNTEEIRELQEIQRVYFSFLQAIISNELSSVLFAPQSKPLLNDVIQSILDASCSHKDMLVRKICVQLFIKLIRDWCGTFNDDEVPGFCQFIIETFAPKCCMYSVLDRSFNLRDANTLSLFGEIVAVQKVIYEKCGDNFLIHQATKVLPGANCPPNMAEQYCLHIRHSDLKELKSFYKSLVERLKPQNNYNHDM